MRADERAVAVSLAYLRDLASEGELAEVASFGRGFILAVAVILVVAACTIPIANYWNARGGEEWSVGLVIGSAILTGLFGTVALFQGRRRRWGAGVLVGAILAPLAAGAVFIWYFAILHGS